MTLTNALYPCTPGHGSAFCPPTGSMATPLRRRHRQHDSGLGLSSALAPDALGDAQPPRSRHFLPAGGLGGLLVFPVLQQGAPRRAAARGGLFALARLGSARGLHESQAVDPRRLRRARRGGDTLRVGCIHPSRRARCAHGPGARGFGGGYRRPSSRRCAFASGCELIDRTRRGDRRFGLRPASRSRRLDRAPPSAARGTSIVDRSAYGHGARAEQRIFPDETHVHEAGATRQQHGNRPASRTRAGVPLRERMPARAPAGGAGSTRASALVTPR